METKILVTYATIHGSTREVAEMVATTLNEQGYPVDVQPSAKVKILAGYKFVVLGIPLYIGHIHRDAQKFLTRHQKAFCAGLPIAVFAGGPLEIKDDVDEIRESLDQDLAKYPWLKPVAVEIVGGKFDPRVLHFPWMLLPAVRKMAPNDLRDWDAIRSWAKALPNKLQPARQ